MIEGLLLVSRMVVMMHRVDVGIMRQYVLWVHGLLYIFTAVCLPIKLVHAFLYILC